MTVIRSFEVKEERAFLLTFKSRKPDWSLLGLDGIDRLPAVRWKLKNLGKLSLTLDPILDS